MRDVYIYMIWQKTKSSFKSYNLGFSGDAPNLVVLSVVIRKYYKLVQDFLYILYHLSSQPRMGRTMVNQGDYVCSKGSNQSLVAPRDSCVTEVDRRVTTMTHNLLTPQLCLLFLLYPATPTYRAVFTVHVFSRSRWQRAFICWHSGAILGIIAVFTC